MGGVKVTPSLETAVPNLFAIGEAVGGANGANRLSGNAVTEALVFGKHAALVAAGRAKGALAWRDAAAEAALALVGSGGAVLPNLAALVASLQDTMADLVGPFRNQAGLVQALENIAGLRAAAGTLPPGQPAQFDLQRLDWFDLRNMLLVAEAVTMAALSRTESRGAHQREDHIGLEEGWTRNQVLHLRDGALVLQ
jgi:succinate dehydrogenase/fumarate reductase flavoprotein subunit